jgi:uncharacterized protein with HEPN domain
MIGTDVFLNHIIDSIEKIEDFTSGKAEMTSWKTYSFRMQRSEG